MFKRVALVVGGLLALLIAAVAINTLRQGSRQLDVPPAPPLAVDEKAVADTLAQAVRFRTVSSASDPMQNSDEFRKLHAHLERSFPLVHQKLKREVVDGLNLLYTWQGSDPAAKPFALMAHQDVVPIEPGTEPKWESAPFDGAIRDGYIWGRGSWDDKGNLVAELQAVEMLLAAGFQPRQTIYIISGSNEETTSNGARAIAQLLASRNVKLDFVLDEGLFIGEGFVPGLAKPVATIGIAEKGYISLTLSATGTPGHSSAPPAPGNTSIAILSAALTRLDQQQMPPHLDGAARELFETIAPEMQGMQRVALSNLWLFGPLVQSQMGRGGALNSMVRTTTALTIVQGGMKDNVIPERATAVANFRILPGESRETVMAHVRSVVGERVQVKPLLEGKDPTPVSPTTAVPYQVLNRTLRSLYPDVIVAPALFTAGSDSAAFVGLTENIYRFSPIRVKAEDLPRIHGTNERIATANLAGLVRFYSLLIRNASLERPTP
ncbi:MAG TPA: M20 family peptidase [Ramlibacter sp.]|nr:M20 family peptidase [Ramlibacter sp.]